MGTRPWASFIRVRSDDPIVGIGGTVGRSRQTTTGFSQSARLEVGLEKAHQIHHDRHDGLRDDHQHVGGLHHGQYQDVLRSNLHAVAFPF